MIGRIMRVSGYGALFVAASYLPAHLFAARPEQAATPPIGQDSLRPVLDRYCATCHNSKLKTAGLALDTLDLGQVDQHQDEWERIARKLRTHEMPPPGLPRPDQATYARTAASIEEALDRASLARPNPGRVVVHRLNRTEYTNAVRDLLSLDVDGRALLPADEPDQQGFDNVAGVLSVSPRLLENYMTEANTISRLAIGNATITPVEDTVRIPTATAQDDRASEELPFGSRGGVSVRSEHDQPARDRQRDDHPGRGHGSHSHRDRAGRSCQRGTTVWITRRRLDPVSLPARRRLP